MSRDDPAALNEREERDVPEALLAEPGPTGTPRLPADRRAGRDRKTRTLARREASLGWAFTAPAVVIVLVLVIFPIIWNVALSFRQLRLVELRNVSLFSLDLTLDNYDQVIGADFLGLLRNTLIYAIGGTTLALLLGLWAAMTLRRFFRGRSLVRGLILFPYVVPVVAAALLWRTMLNPQVGFISVTLQDLLGVAPVDPFLERGVALWMVVIFEGWRSFPFAFLFILARLQAIPSDMEEAARVDGATVLQRFWYIILPQLRGVFAVLFLLRFIWTFNAFDEIYLLTAGSAGTEVISVQIYEWLFGRSDVGAAAALSIVLAATLAVGLGIYFRWFYTEENA
jgi:multiple sugar transport system permease protein